MRHQRLTKQERKAIKQLRRSRQQRHLFESE